MLAVKDYVRDALLTAALFGSIGAAWAQTPPATSGDTNAVKPAPATGPTAVFINGSLNVPNAPKDTSTAPAKFSAVNAKLDAPPTLARGPALSDAERQLIIDRVTSVGTLSVPYAGPTTQLPPTTETHAWPADLLQQVPSLADTKYLAIPGKILLVRPDTSIVIGEIDH
jgi:subtilisin family serine protease